MFCNKCGANLPDGATFCTNCGAQMNPAQPDQSVYQQPTYQQPAYGYQPQPVLSKGEYLKTQASSNTKLLVKIAWGLLALCVLVIGLGLNSCLNGPVYNIPVVKLAMGDDYAEAIEDLTDILGEADDEIDDFRDRYEDEIKENDLDKLVDASIKMAKNPSLNNVKKVGKLMYQYDLGGMNQSDLEAFELIITIIWVVFGIIMALAVLGGVLKNIVPLIIAAILSIPVNLIFSGVLYMFLSLVALIALMVVLSKINKEYKTYKKTQQPAYGY